MATVEEVAGLALSAVDVSADKPIGLPQVGRWVVERYREIAAKSRFRHLRQIGSITIPNAVQTGAATVAVGATAVTLDATAQAAVTAVGGAAALGTKDWYIRFSTSTWYPVASYLSPTLTLSNAYTEDAVTAGGFLLLKRFHRLDVTARWMGKFVYPRRRRPLELRALHDLDSSSPERQLTADGPWYVSEATRVPADTTDLGTAGAKRVELYPYNRTNETVYYTFWAIPASLALEDTIPQEIDPYVLREGVLIDVYRYRASQAANAGSVEIAGYWRNEARAQYTSWQVQMQDAARADRGQDDVSFILHTLGLGGGDRRDIATARDEVWARGNRP
jgi:hypothetical protein